MRRTYRSMSASELCAAAYHEAGHAVVGMILGRRIKQVEIGRPNSGAAGGVEFDEGAPALWSRKKSPHSRRLLRREVKIAWAGLLAENRYIGHSKLDGTEREDAKLIMWALRRMAKSRSSQESLGSELCVQCEILLDAHWRLVHNVAQRLLQVRALERKELLSMRRAHLATLKKCQVVSSKGRRSSP